MRFITPFSKRDLPGAIEFATGNTIALEYEIEPEKSAAFLAHFEKLRP